MKKKVLTQFAGPLVALMLIAMVVGVTTPSFLASENFRNIALQVAVLSIVALGATVVILTGGIDLSPGSMIAYLSMILAVMIKLHAASLWIAIPAVILLGGFLGLVNGILVSYLKIPAFIVTLAGLSAFKGIALTVGGGTPIFSLSPDLGLVFYGELFGIPLPFYYVVALYAFATLLLNHTKFGREIYAIGGNESAARLSGIQVSRVRFIAYVIAGACAGIGAVLLAARLNSGSPNYGTLIELQAIAGAVVGGASLAGGRGHVLNTLIGVLIIVVVQNGLNLNAVSTSVQSITIGLIILLAVGVDIWRERISQLIAEWFGNRNLQT
jgi:ribose transport system permease protein